MKLLKLRLLLSAFVIVIGIIVSLLVVPLLEVPPIPFLRANHLAFLTGFLIPTLGCTWFPWKKTSGEK